MPGLEKYVSARVDVVVTLPNVQLREILHYYSNNPTSGLVQMNNKLMMITIKKHMD